MRTLENSKEEGKISYQVVVKNDLSGTASPSNPVIRVAPVGQETVNTSKMAKEISAVCTLTPADVMAVLAALSDYLKKTLLSGNRLEVDNIGTFNISLACSWKDCSGKTHEHTTQDNISNGDKVRVNNIVFTPAPALKEEVVNNAVCISSGLYPYEAPTAEVIETKLTEWFVTHFSITRKDTEWLFGCSRRYAHNLLTRLVSEGRLSAEGSRNMRYYKPVEGSFGG